MLDEVIEAGLDEDVMGWGSWCRQVDKECLAECISNEDKLEELVQLYKPRLREYLRRCKDEDDGYAKELEEANR